MNKIILENYSLPAVSSCDTLEDLLYVLGRECTSSLHTICVNQQEIGLKTDPLGVLWLSSTYMERCRCLIFFCSIFFFIPYFDEGITTSLSSFVNDK